MSARALASCLLAACSSAPTVDIAGLAALPPLPYSVLLTGGAFLVPPPGAGEGVLARTYALTEPEAFALAQVGEVLLRARVFAATAVDPRPPPERRLLASLSGERTDPHTPDLQQFLDGARDAGHDLLLVVEQLRDGPIDVQGINGQWPVTVLTWFMVGLGMLIPDHTYESRASLRVSVRDVQSGGVLYEQVLSGGPIDLSLIDRSDALGLVESIVVPPFWVGDADEQVLGQVRAIATRRLLESLARQLKSVDASERITERQAAHISVSAAQDRLVVAVNAQQPLSFLRLRVDGAPLPLPAATGFERALLDSVQQDGTRWRYTAPLMLPAGAHMLQVLVQTVGGRVSSTTAVLRETAR
jgi:hypothetical protein